MIINFIIIILFVFISAYNIGYKQGKKEGFKSAKASSNLIFLEKSLRIGYCIVCKKEL